MISGSELQEIVGMVIFTMYQSTRTYSEIRRMIELWENWKRTYKELQLQLYEINVIGAKQKSQQQNIQ